MAEDKDTGTEKSLKDNKEQDNIIKKSNNDVLSDLDEQIEELSKKVKLEEMKIKLKDLTTPKTPKQESGVDLNGISTFNDVAKFKCSDNDWKTLVDWCKNK